MKQLICPKCFAPFHLEESSYVCVNAGCQAAGNQIAPETVHNDANGRPVCTACRGVLTIRVCPHCGFELSDNSASEQTLTLSVVGAESSGKSNYLSVLIDRVKNEMGKVYNCSLFPSGGDMTIRQYDLQYYNPLFVQGRCITSTEQETIQPLIYSLVFGGEEGMAHGRNCNITFYDACGANFDSINIMSDYNRSIYNSQGIIFLIDPVQLPDVRDAMGLRSDPWQRVDPNTLLSRTIQLIRGGNTIKNMKQKIRIPIAVCLSKLDTVKPRLDPSSFLKYNTRHMDEPSFNKLDFEACSMETQSLLQSWSGEELVNQVRAQFEHYGFFGFSALGSAPDSANQVGRIMPHRVCDPFLWLLHKNRIIQGN